MGSLRGSTLFHIRLEGDRVHYVEPLFTREGTRLRDVAGLNGGFATLTNDGTIMIFRNAEKHASEPRSVSVTGFGTLSAAYAEEVPPPNLTPAQRGKDLFAVNCSHCHSHTTDIGPGPPLGGIVGRPVGAEHLGLFPRGPTKGVWTEDYVISFLTEPNTLQGHALMPPPTMDWLEYERRGLPGNARHEVETTK
jgi:cytochrome c2